MVAAEEPGRNRNDEDDERRGILCVLLRGCLLVELRQEKDGDGAAARASASSAYLCTPHAVIRFDVSIRYLCL